MLVITRRRGQKIQIGRDIEVMVTKVFDGQVRLAIKAPPEVLIAREELLKKDKPRIRPKLEKLLQPFKQRLIDKSRNIIVSVK